MSDWEESQRSTAAISLSPSLVADRNQWYPVLSTTLSKIFLHLTSEPVTPLFDKFNAEKEFFFIFIFFTIFGGNLQCCSRF